MNSKSLIDIRSQVTRAINGSEDGVYANIPIGLGFKIQKALDQLIHIEKNHEDDRRTI